LIFPFKPLPGSGSDVARPAVPIDLVGPESVVSLLCLVDTGSVHNRLAAWVADAAVIDHAAADVTRIAVGGTTTEARTVTCQLQIGDFTWEAPVSFCDPWPFDFQVLGHLGFFRWFRVVIDAADEMMEIIPNRV